MSGAREFRGDGMGFCQKLYGEVRIGASSWKVPRISKEGGRAVQAKVYEDRSFSAHAMPGIV